MRSHGATPARANQRGPERPPTAAAGNARSSLGRVAPWAVIFAGHAERRIGVSRCAPLAGLDAHAAHTAGVAAGGAAGVAAVATAGQDQAHLAALQDRLEIVVAKAVALTTKRKGPR